MASPRKSKPADVGSAAVPAEALIDAFPKLNLPIQPPYPPAEAKSVKDLPREAGWVYEPKWDGFRCLAFRQGDEVVLQSKSGQPLGRYFPEIVAALLALPTRKFVLDGEIVIRHGAGLDFDALLQRIHPAASRIQRLSQETPATYMVFDLLIDAFKGRSFAANPLSARRMALQEFATANISNETAPKRSEKTTSQTASNSASERIILSPASADFATAGKWMREGASSGWDGVVAKRLDCEYMSGERTGMVKIKRIRTADCVVGGFRWARGPKSSSGEPVDGKGAGSENQRIQEKTYRRSGLTAVGFVQREWRARSHWLQFQFYSRRPKEAEVNPQAVHRRRRIFRQSPWWSQPLDARCSRHRMVSAEA